MRPDRRRIWRGIAAAATAGLLCRGWAAGAIPACGYDVEIVAFDCGYPLGTTVTFGYGLAPDGTVVGVYWDCQAGSSQQHAFVWPPGGSMQVVPYPSGMFSMELFDANDAGQAVGTLVEYDGYWSEAFRLDKGRVIPLGVLPGADASEALAVNGQGVAVGWSGFTLRVPRNAVLWKPDGTIIDLALDLGRPVWSGATGLTDSGMVTGWMGVDPTIDAVPFIWDAGTVIELPLLPEPAAYATTSSAINEFGNVCGWGLVPMPGIDYGQAYAFIDGRPISLGTLPGYYGSGANDINNLNQIVGRCQGDAPFAAFVWDAGVMHDLSAMIDPALDLRISNATAIADSGIIAGEATDASGDSFAVRLRPRLRLSADLDCDGFVGVADLQLFIAHWGVCTAKSSCPADLNADGVVNGYDLGMLLGSWG